MPGDDPGRPPRQLPADVRGFVNREAELRALDAILGDSGATPPLAGVHVLAGTAGVGKTSLAVHWAHRVREHFPDGQLCINLRGYDPGPPLRPADVLDRFLRALDVPAAAVPADPEDRAALYRSMLADRRMLILLDNASSTRQVRPLLPGAPRCLVIVTSRSRLSGLVARDGARRLTVDLLPEPDAVSLLRTLTAGYRLDDDSPDYAELARLCARLPLALRIAAERAASRPHMPLADLIRDLRDESALWDALTAEDQDEADAVRTVFAWSYRALDEGAARLFRLLGLHPGAEFGPEAAAALAGVPITTARQRLDLLVGAHLIEQTEADRYQFHDLLRAYAADQCQEEPPAERDAALRRVLEWYLHTVDAAERLAGGLDLRVPLDRPAEPVPAPPFGDRSAAVRWERRERGTLLAAVRAAAGDPRTYDLAWLLAAVLRGFHMRENVLEDWFAAATLGLHAATALGDRRAEAELYDSLGVAHVHAHRLHDALACHTKALSRRRDLGDRLAHAVSLNALGLTALRARQLDAAVAHFADGIEIFGSLGERVWEATARANLGTAQYELGTLDDADASVRQALDTLRAAGDAQGEGNALRLLSAIHRAQGRIDDALTAGLAAVNLAAAHGNAHWQGYWLIELGAAQAAAGEHGDALGSYQHAATLHRRAGDRGREGIALIGAADTYHLMGRYGDAIRMYRGALAVLRTTGDAWQLARALDGLATALDATGEPERAGTARRQALDHLAAFTDPEARRRRDRISGR
ncbi:ATP-binding protein [Catenuloplanes atrovinosus]|uniref:Tetratricopeptide (TPR) repeat protein n=1 Tax=Catenuloplanes atrovinosus TaxID=137266 RepID=A0AAE4CAX6_9ACTN|nr:tetratricopeptide repeat protein [Catenuloplanes atrovinosus]MDR7277452.1 tetratricopeptide (TPR) repeat protein [Catenuloplanes atrovinosus]